MKSHASDLLELARCVYIDACAKCSDVSLDSRDLDTLKSRVEHEGLSFLTITLPTLGKDFEISLSQGKIDPTFFRSFRKKAKAPAFLQGFFGHVFDREGRLLDEPSIDCIEAIRQLAYCFKKIKIECAPHRVRNALAKFKQDEQVFNVPLDPVDTKAFADVSTILWSCVLGGTDVLSDAFPKHGPGATGEKLSGNAKYKLSRWHDRLEPYFPLIETVLGTLNSVQSEEFKRVTVVEEQDEQPVRIVPVPKTLKTPRIIAIEPVCMMYVQQALQSKLYAMIESHPLTSGHVNFTNQKINRDLAIESSKTGLYATIDMSSASDLVPYELAISMFDSNPDLQDCISACRSKTAQLPDGELVPLKKFASMGSALCFPVEAMYFYTICVVALLRKHNLPCTYHNIKWCCSRCYVYGDDIIVPTDSSIVVMDTLQKYYCKVNVRKSFNEGFFRESCGMDAYAGYEVTPTYVRELRPHNKRNAKAIVSWVSASNSFHLKGYWQTSHYMRKHVEHITGRLPVVGKNCGGLGWHNHFGSHVSIHRWSPSTGSRNNYQRPEVKTWVAVPVYRKDPLKGYAALTKCLLNLERSDPQSDPSVDRRHLERSARHGAVALKRRWLPPW